MAKFLELRKKKQQLENEMVNTVTADITFN